jgi:hypothetical protein
VESLSRFTLPADRRRILADFQAGEVDVLVGTHALLGSEVRPRDLGLVVVDEEQRFGVRHKERIKEYKTSVDVLTLTATPIPRTMQMGLASLRDISVIETPPAGRRSILTHVGPYDEDLVRHAIEREVARGGQTFFVHNRVESIDEVAQRLRELLPGVRFVTAHGQMPERALEGVMKHFLDGRADVLVTTTIVESGLDVATANTLIVDRADTMGLAQLYQLRGRIGRSTEQAYAYLFAPLGATPESQKRLEALMDFTELGSGFAIATLTFIQFYIVMFFLRGDTVAGGRPQPRPLGRVRAEPELADDRPPVATPPPHPAMASFDALAAAPLDALATAVLLVAFQDRDPQDRFNLFELLQQIDLLAVHFNCHRHEQPLRFQRPIADALLELLEHHALVQGVLIDDDHAIVILRDEVAGMNLHHAVDGSQPRQLCFIAVARLSRGRVILLQKLRRLGGDRLLDLAVDEPLLHRIKPAKVRGKT